MLGAKIHLAEFSFFNAVKKNSHSPEMSIICKIHEETDHYFSIQFNFKII